VCSFPPVCTGSPVVARDAQERGPWEWRCTPTPPAFRPDGCPGVQPTAGAACKPSKLECAYGRCGGEVLGCRSGRWEVLRMIAPPP
jgi:hypothetical protein